MHMENARAETGKSRTPSSRYITYTNLRNSPSDKESSGKTKIANKENIKHGLRDLHKSKTSNNNIMISNGDLDSCKDISRKMDELAAFARDSLARVEALTSKNNELAKCSFRTSNAQKSEGEARTAKSYSILRKKSVEDIIDQPNMELPHPAGPVSILKRKVSQDEGKLDNTAAPSANLPVTFSPSVVEPTVTNRKQGILKKRRSLDESQVLRHRSCSPDTNIVNGRDSRSILKGQRRSSLEEITRTQSPDSHLQGILKRKSSRNEDDMEHLLNSPQGILKRKSNASSAGSSSTSSHVSITTAVILAAAGGAEMVLEADAVKPILKKKSFSEERPCNETISHDTPKPILKKKSSTDTDDSEERPKKPILKLSRRSLDGLEKNGEDFTLYKQNSTESDWEVRPILKQSGREETQRSKLSFCVNDQLRSSSSAMASMRHKSLDEAHTDFTEERRPRPVSVSELVMNFEKAPSPSHMGAVPKKYNAKRNCERYRTQPITHNEVEDR